MQTERKGRGRPAHRPTEETRALVDDLAGLGLTRKAIAARVGICIDTLVLHYAAELENGPSRTNEAVARNLYELAVSDGKGAAQAAMFWLKCRAGWRDKDAPQEAPQDAAAQDAPKPEAGADWDALLN